MANGFPLSHLFPFFGNDGRVFGGVTFSRVLSPTLVADDGRSLGDFTLSRALSTKLDDDDLLANEVTL